MAPTCSSFRLYHFRCHQELSLELTPGWHFFLGANGQGKTSLLEALYYLSRLRSWRTTALREIAQWKQPLFRVEAQYGDQHLSATWTPQGRRLHINQQEITSLSEFWGQLPTVLFMNEDRELITGPALIRRKWIDGLLAKRRPTFIPLAQAYQRTLRQRNAWLKQSQRDRQLGESLTTMLTRYGQQITRERAELSQHLAPLLQHYETSLTNQDQPLTFNYQPSFSLEAEPDWEKIRSREEHLGHTLLGPHRDDWSLQREGYALALFGSEGQQRAAALSFRFAEAEWIRQSRQTWPLFLIDDVAPQLDQAKKKRLRELLPTEAQIFFTSPEFPGIPPATYHAWNVAPSHIVPFSC